MVRAVVDRSLLVNAFVFFVLLCLSGSAAANGCGCKTASDTYYHCGDTVTESCTLTCNLNAVGQDCFTIGADGITIDFNGYSITGDSYGYDDDAGILINGYNGITIINGSVSGFTYGVVIYNSNNSKLLGGDYSSNGPTDDYSNDNNGYNIYIEESENFVIRDLLVNTPRDSVSGGSCPFMYSWDGEKYDFQTDLAAKGKLINPNAAKNDSKIEPVDYYLIEKENLEAKDGVYSLNLLEQRDEVDYVDNVKLYQIEHPEGSQVFITEEKTDGIVTGMTVYAVNRTIAPTSCRTDTGEDCLAQVLSADHDNVELGDSENPAWHYIDLTFGVIPGDAILVVKGHNNVPKTPEGVERKQNITGKTTEIDYYKGTSWKDTKRKIEHPAEIPRYEPANLTGSVSGNNYTLRIKYMMNVFIDYVAIGTDAISDINIVELNLSGAELSDRGLAAQVNDTLPFDMIYENVIPVPETYSYFNGNYTKYGDVLQLLQDIDDMFVVMERGSNLEMQFDETATESDYDFVIRYDGYYKARRYMNDTNATVGPLPFHDMSAYPYPEDESYPTDSEHNEYQAEWNTRERNDTMHNSAFAIFLVDSDYGLIDNVNGTCNSTYDCYGVIVLFSDEINITNCMFTTGESGVEIVFSYGSRVLNSILRSNDDYGIYTLYLWNGTISGNTANENYIGIHLYYASFYNTVSGNTANDNTYGIVLEDAWYNTLDSNTALRSEYDGILLDSSAYNTLRNNTANESGADGIHFWNIYAEENTVDDNVFCNNNQDSWPDAYDINNVDTNRGARNTCNTTYYWFDTGALACSYYCGGPRTMTPLENCVLDMCTPGTLCSHGFGDCDTDADCLPGLFCDMNTGRYYGCQWWVDICTHEGYVVESSSSSSRASSSMESSTSRGSSIASSTSTSSVESSSSTSSSSSSSSSVVTLPTTTTLPNCMLNRCTPLTPCSHGYGDCDTDADCDENLTCEINVGAYYGCQWWVDICKKPALNILEYFDGEEEDYSGSLAEYLVSKGHTVTRFNDGNSDCESVPESPCTGIHDLDLNDYMDYDVIIAIHPVGGGAVLNLQNWFSNGKGYVGMLGDGNFNDPEDDYIMGILGCEDTSCDSGSGWSSSGLSWADLGSPIRTVPNSGWSLTSIPEGQYQYCIDLTGGSNVVTGSCGAVMQTKSGVEGAGRIVIIGTNYHNSGGILTAGAQTTGNGMQITADEPDTADSNARQMVENMASWAGG